MSLQKRKDIRPPYLAIICPYFVMDRFSNICTTPAGILPPGRFTLTKNYSDIIQVYCSMAGRGCILAVCARPDGSHMPQSAWFFGHTIVCCCVLCSSKNKKDTQPLYFAVVCPYFMIDLVSNICTTRVGILPPGRFTLTKLL